RARQAQVVSQMVGNDGRRNRYVPLQEPAQYSVDPTLRFLGRQLQDPKVILSCAAGTLFQQRIVGSPKSTRWEHRVPIAIASKRSGLPHQPINYMTIIDVMFIAATETG